MDFLRGTLSSPPAFDGNNFQYQKQCMAAAFLQDLGDDELQMIDAWYTPPTKSQGIGDVGITVSKPVAEWSEKQNSQFNSLGKNAIFMAVGEQVQKNLYMQNIQRSVMKKSNSQKFKCL